MTTIGVGIESVKRLWAPAIRPGESDRMAGGPVGDVETVDEGQVA